jgi:large subunit ribosomal protein L4
MISVPVYDPAGQKIGEEQIDPADFGGQVNKQLLHEVVVMQLANRRVGTVHTRGRADVAGSGKKLFRQKGTGNARVGAKRTNKRKGGGMAFARRNRDYSYALPKKAVRQAIRMAILSKFLDGQAVVLEGLGASTPDARPKTKPVARALAAVRKPDLKDEPDAPPPATKAAARTQTLVDGSVLIGLPSHDKTLYLSARNLPKVKVAPIAEFNTYDVLKQRYLVLTREALSALKERVKEPVRRRAGEGARVSAAPTLTA